MNTEGRVSTPVLVLFLIVALFPGACSKPQVESSVSPLFDGDSLSGWRVITDWIGGGADVSVIDGAIHIADGTVFNGIVREDFSKPDGPYEIRLEAMRVEGRDIFLGITFPVVGKDTCISFVAGGWGGETTGLSNIDGMDAMENATGSAQRYENGRWYAFRIRVSEERIDVWMDERHICGVYHFDKKISMRPGEADLTVPFGFFTYATTSAIRKVEMTTRIDKSTAP